VFPSFQIFLQNAVLDTVVAATGAILFTMYILYDTHMIMEKLSPEDYIDAAVSLYLDIVNLFINLLRLFGKRKD
jgi:FtsH-binding integral membrane protein